MKKLIVLLVILSSLITTGCKTLEVKHKIELPPKPQRQELKEPADLKDLAELLNYYEHLVEEWEAWAEVTTELIEN